MISKKILWLLFGLALLTSLAFMNKPLAIVKNNITANSKSRLYNMYDELDLASLGLSRKAYELAIAGYKNLLAGGKILNVHILSVADFSLPSNKKRLFVLDVLKGELLFHTFVSHGRNSGKLVAKRFSNKANSYQSSMGFYTTGEPYAGKHGLSLRLFGREKGINDKALKRGIVMHGADYAEENVVAKQGFLGRSLGCPAIPLSVHRELIQSIQNGSCFFIFAPIKAYAIQSTII